METQPQSAVSYAFLFWPAIYFAIATTACFLLYRYAKPQIAQFVDAEERRGLRAGLRVVFLLALPLVVAALVDWLDLTAVIDGVPAARDLFILKVLAIGVPIWFTAQALDWWHAAKWEEAVRTAEADAAAAEEAETIAKRQRNFYVNLGRVVFRIIGLKADRIRAEVHARNVEPGDPQQHLDRVRRALDPAHQILELLIAIHSFFWRTRIPQLDPPSNASLRIAYYIRDGDYLVPVRSFDGVNTDCISSPSDRHREKFRLTGDVDQNCLAVACALADKRWVVEDAAAADADPDKPFSFFDASQEEKIKSIVALPLRRQEAGLPVNHVVTIDTNVEGLFPDDEPTHEELQTLAENLAYRLLLERDMIDLLA